MTGRRRPLGCRLEYFGSPSYHCCRPAFRQVGDKHFCGCFRAPALQLDERVPNLSPSQNLQRAVLCCAVLRCAVLR